MPQFQIGSPWVLLGGKPSLDTSIDTPTCKILKRKFGSVVRPVCFWKTFTQSVRSILGNPLRGQGSINLNAEAHRIVIDHGERS